MKLKTGLQIGAVFPILMALFMVLGLLVRGHAISAVDRTFVKSTALLQHAVELQDAATSHLAKPDAAGAERWESAQAALEQSLRSVRTQNASQRACVSSIRSASGILAEVLARVTVSQDQAAPAVGEVNEQLKVITMESARLARTGFDRWSDMQKEIDYITGPVLGLMALIMAASVLVSGRHILERFSSIRQAIASVAHGNYDHEIPVLGDAEVDVLSSAFNNMSKQLKLASDTKTEPGRKADNASEGYRKSNMMLADALTKLKRAQGQLIDGERINALKQMTGGIARDFNSTLTPILGLSDYMLENPTSLDNRDAAMMNMRAINQAARAAREHVKHLADFFKPVGETRTEPVDLSAVIKDTIELLRSKWESEARARGVNITISTMLDELPRVRVNPSAVKEAVCSLLINAIEAVTTKEGRITVSTSADDKMARIMVTDSGQGMTDDIQRRCLEPFYSTKNADHAGMGLTTAYNFFRKHGGRIEIESRIGGGTSVRAWLPFDLGESATIVKKRQESPQQKVPSPLKILVVDDEIWVLNSLEKVLGQYGNQVTTCSTPAEALEKYKAGEFNVAILDRAMPGMSGDELAAAIKKEGRGTPVILLTGFGDIMKDKGETVPGVDLVLSKPATISEIRQALSDVLSKSAPAT